MLGTRSLAGTAGLPTGKLLMELLDTLFAVRSSGRQHHARFTTHRTQFWKNVFDQCIVGIFIFQLLMIGLLGKDGLEGGRGGSGGRGQKGGEKKGAGGREVAV